MAQHLEEGVSMRLQTWGLAKCISGTEIPSGSRALAEDQIDGEENLAHEVLWVQFVVTAGLTCASTAL